MKENFDEIFGKGRIIHDSPEAMCDRMVGELQALDRQLTSEHQNSERWFRESITWQEKFERLAFSLGKDFSEKHVHNYRKWPNNSDIAECDCGETIKSDPLADSYTISKLRDKVREFHKLYPQKSGSYDMNEMDFLYWLEYWVEGDADGDWQKRVLEEER